MFTFYLFLTLVTTTIIFTMKGSSERKVEFSLNNFSRKDYVLGIVSKEENGIDRLIIGLLFFTITLTTSKEEQVSTN